MSDDLERRLRDVPARVPRPRPEVTRRVRERVVRTRVSALVRGRRVSVGVLVALVLGMALGYWAIPQEEPAIGAADPPAVTIDAQPRVLQWDRGEPIVVSGTVITRRAGERVVVEENVCDSGWSEVAATTTTAGGTWAVSETIGYMGPRANAAIRAKWRGVVSAAVTVRVRPGLSLRKKSRNVYTVEVNASRPLDGRRVQLERYDRSNGRWGVVRRARLVRTSYGYQTKATFRAALPKRTILRAVLPAAQARPCYMAGYSRLETSD